MTTENQGYTYQFQYYQVDGSKKGKQIPKPHSPPPTESLKKEIEKAWKMVDTAQVININQNSMRTMCPLSVCPLDDLSRVLLYLT